MPGSSGNKTAVCKALYNVCPFEFVNIESFDLKLDQELPCRKNADSHRKQAGVCVLLKRAVGIFWYLKTNFKKANQTKQKNHLVF